MWVLKILRSKFLATAISLLYLVGLVVVCVWVRVDDGSFWPVTAFSFAPRWALLIPLALLVPWSFYVSRRIAWFYLFHCFVTFFWVMNFEVPNVGELWRSAFDNASNIDSGEFSERVPLRIMTYNMGEGEIDLDRLVELLRAEDIHALLLQESLQPEAQHIFENLGWEFVRKGSIVIGSTFPTSNFRILAFQPETHEMAVAALACDLAVPRPMLGTRETESVTVVAVHMPTFRFALEHLPNLEFSLVGPAIDEFTVRYETIARDTLDQTPLLEQPTVIAGDLNVPADSGYYDRNWGQLRNAFSQLGFGFGFTKYTRFHGVRIDHVLYNHHFRVRNIFVGPGLGGDHRPVVAELELQ